MLFSSGFDHVMKKCPHLQTLVARECMISVSALRAIGQMTSLKRLDLSGSYFNVNTFDFANFGEIEHLILSNIFTYGLCLVIARFARLCRPPSEQ